MFIRIFLPILAILGVLLGLFMVYYGSREVPTPPIAFQPPQSPYAHFVAGSGLVEASSENIYIGTPLTGLVKKIFADKGAIVDQGCPIFALDTRELEAQLEEAKTNYRISLANFQKQLALPRPEEVPELEAIVKQREANLEDQKTQLALYERVKNREAISENEFNQRRFAAIGAKYALEEAQSKLNLLKAGAWIRDIEISRAELENALAKVKTIETNLERTIIRAPIKGMVLQSNIRVGELVQPVYDPDTPLVLFGSIIPFNIRIDIDENDAWRVKKGAPGIAFVRGNSSINVSLKFEYIEPYIVPKVSLTGGDTERVDTRVLQVVYSFEPKDLPIYMGQLMDVFLEAEPNRY